MDITKAEFLRRVKAEDTFCCFVVHLAKVSQYSLKLNSKTPRFIIKSYFDTATELLKDYEIKKK